MEKPRPTTPELKASKTWEHLEDFVRDHVQQFIQALLEEEVTELLGRTKSARRGRPLMCPQAIAMAMASPDG